MKKRLVSAAVFCCLLCGCSGGFRSGEVSAEELQLTFDCPALIQVKDRQYSCYIYHSIAQHTEITMTGSGALDGLQYRQSGNDAALFYDGLEYAAKEKSLPQQACFTQIADVLNCAQSYVNLESLGENVFVGSVEGERFQITADTEGRILNLETDELTVVFDPATENKPE